MLMSNNGNKIKFNWIIVDVFPFVHWHLYAVRHIASIKIPQQTQYGMAIFWDGTAPNQEKGFNCRWMHEMLFVRCMHIAHEVADNLCVNDWSGHSSSIFLVQMTLNIVDVKNSIKISQML